jgi:hypothetical protein
MPTAPRVAGFSCSNFLLCSIAVVVVVVVVAAVVAIVEDEEEVVLAAEKKLSIEATPAGG